MQRRGSAFNGFAVEASDGFAGRITDLLFDDKTWLVRWFVVEIATWQIFRRILLHPSALGSPDNLNRAFSVQMTKAQVRACPSIQTDEPVSQQMEADLAEDYAFSPPWGLGFYASGPIGGSAEGWLDNNGVMTHAATGTADPHLRSINAVRGYHIQALDGEVGHLKDFLIDDETWQIDCALIDTKNWWRGKDVLLPATAMTQISWSGKYISVDQTRYKIKTSQSWTKPDWSTAADV
jgi:hypothetical protein